jgi:hypothetical protein
MGRVFAHQFDGVVVEAVTTVVQSDVFRAFKQVRVAVAHVADSDCGPGTKDLGFCVDNKASFALIRGPVRGLPLDDAKLRQSLSMEARCPRPEQIGRIG